MPESNNDIEKSPYEQLLEKMKEQDDKINALSKKVEDVTNFNKVLLDRSTTTHRGNDNDITEEERALAKLEQYINEK